MPNTNHKFNNEINEFVELRNIVHEKTNSDFFTSRHQEGFIKANEEERAFGHFFGQNNFSGLAEVANIVIRDEEDLEQKVKHGFRFWGCNKKQLIDNIEVLKEFIVRIDNDFDLGYDKGSITDKLVKRYLGNGIKKERKPTQYR